MKSIDKHVKKLGEVDRSDVRLEIDKTLDRISRNLEEEIDRLPQGGPFGSTARVACNAVILAIKKELQDGHSS